MPRILTPLLGLLLCAMAFLCLDAGRIAWAEGGGTAPSEETAPIVLAQMDWRSLNPVRPLLRLFKGDERPRYRKRAPTRQKQRSTSRSSSSSSSGSGNYSKPRFVEQVKDPDAGVLLVVGDEMADGVAEGLKFTLLDKPMVRTEKLVARRSGLAGDDALDWSGKISAYDELERVRAVVVMIGQHDTGEALPGEPPVEFGTQAWSDAYRARVRSLISTLKDLRKPVIWIGLPPTNSDLTNVDFQLFNQIIREESEAAKTSYVGLWYIFLSDSGEYSSFGPDVDGQQKRLRSSDRVGFTWEGYLKVAFFVERELTRVLGGYGGLAFEGIADDPDFIVLTGRSTSSETDLLGADGSGTSADEPRNTLGYRVLVKGEVVKAPAGRVDNWQRPVSAADK